MRTLVSRLDPSHPLAVAEWDGHLAVVTGRVARAVAMSLYARHRQLITVKRLDGGSVADRPVLADPTVECVAADSLVRLRELASEIPDSFRDSAADLARRVAHGCVVFLARRPRAAGGYEIVGYEISERGIFSALGRRHRVSEDVIFSHYAEVLPAHRGRRIHGLLFAARDAYFRERGGRLVVGVCLPQNHASLKALRRDGASVVGSVAGISLFRVFGILRTPLEQIETALQLDGNRPARGPWWLRRYAQRASALLLR